MTVQESDIVRAGERGGIRLNRKLFVDKRQAEMKCALEEGSTCINRCRRKTEREHTCSSALTPGESERSISRHAAACVCVCAQVFSMLVLSECSCLLSQVNVCHI